LMTGKGFAALIWRRERPYFIARGFEQAAADEDVQKIRRFSQDLQHALAGN
jgi:hypothetical protein